MPDHAHVELPGVGRATGCAVSVTHRPPGTLRWVWHHVQPLVCGGQSTPRNLVALCDSCHYSIHVVLWALARHDGNLADPTVLRLGTRRQRFYAEAGWDACVAAGTTGLIPKESDL